MTYVPRTDGLIDEAALEARDDGQEPDEEELLSKTEFVARHMAAMNFRPKEPRHPDCVEFYRVYADASGRTARALAVIRKDATGLEPEKPEYFTVTVQIHIPATIDDIEKKSPGFVRNDLLRIIAAFDDPTTRREALTETCRCGAQTSEFVVLSPTEKLCRPCWMRAGGGGTGW